jgi:TatD DNase family protein
MMGLHPCSVKENYREELAVVESWLKKRPFCAIGEIGIDLYWDKTFLEQQTDAFLTQVKWSVEMNLPIVIHSRESIDLLIDLLQKWEGKKPFGVFHCFGGSVEQAMAIMNLGFYLGIGGVVTYKKSGLQETLKHIPLDFIVLETDSPYLAPVPFRGKRNESSYIRLIAEQVALAKNIDLETVAVVTTANSEKIFEKKSPAYTTLS